MARRWKKRLIGGMILLLGPVIIFLGLDAAFPPDLDRYQTLSVEVRDRDGAPLRIFLSDDGYLRLPTTADAVDPNFIRMLVAYEDKRFYRHFGVDPWALLRATGQALTSGKIVSGGSTLTMQAAKLLEPRARTPGAKIIEMFRAVQLERRLSKDEILSIYLTLAPYGGNREGLRAAALSYFNRPPRALTAGEAALFVALPQAPSHIRPDRFPDRARKARNKILTRIRHTGTFTDDVIDLALREPLRVAFHAPPRHAPHLAERLKGENSAQRLDTWIRPDLQRWTERYIGQYTATLPAGTSAAVVIVENENRHVLSYVGAARYSQDSSDGYMDMVQAIRSPGSVLKPLIYGLAFDQGITHPESRVNDSATTFGAYAPKNFQNVHYGDISVTDALQLSLNIPAVIALERIGPNAFVEKMRRHGVDMILPSLADKPGLAVALGGVGTRLENLVMAYAALASDGRIEPLNYLKEKPSLQRPVPSAPPFLNATTRWQMADILRGVKAPAGLLKENYRPARRDISYKTGTSYGFRDAWAIGYNRDYTIGVWIGRPDGAPNNGHYGADTAAPLLFRLFDRLPAAPGAHLAGPVPLPVTRHADLPPGLQRFDRAVSRTRWVNDIPPPRITFPVTGALIEAPAVGRDLILEATGGKRPLTWVINGYPAPSSRWATTLQWRPDGPGFNEITVIDALGRQATSDIQVQ